MMSDGSRQPPTLLLSSALTGVMWAALRRGASGLRVFGFVGGSFLLSAGTDRSVAYCMPPSAQNINGVGNLHAGPDPSRTRFTLASGNPSLKLEDHLVLPQSSPLVTSWSFMDWKLSAGPPSTASAPRSKVAAALLQGTRRPTLLDSSRLQDLPFISAEVSTAEATRWATALDSANGFEQIYTRFRDWSRKAITLAPLAQNPEHLALREDSFTEIDAWDPVAGPNELTFLASTSIAHLVEADSHLPDESFQPRSLARAFLLMGSKDNQAERNDESSTVRLACELLTGILRTDLRSAAPTSACLSSRFVSMMRDVRLPTTFCMQGFSSTSALREFEAAYNYSHASATEARAIEAELFLNIGESYPIFRPLLERFDNGPSAAAEFDRLTSQLLPATLTSSTNLVKLPALSELFSRASWRAALTHLVNTTPDITGESLVTSLIHTQTEVNQDASASGAFSSSTAMPAGAGTSDVASYGSIRDASIADALRAPEADSALAAAASLSGVERVECLIQSGSLLLTRAVLLQEAWLHNKNAILAFCSLDQPYVTPYFASVLTEDPETGQVPSRLSSYNFPARELSILRTRDWSKLDLLGEALNIRRLRYGSSYTKPKEDETYVVDSCLKIIREHGSRLFFGLNLALSPTEGWSFTDGVDKQIRAVEFANTLPKTECLEWITFLSEQFKTNWLDAGGAHYHSKLRTGRPDAPAAQLSEFLPTINPYFTNVDARLKRAEPVAEFRVAFPTMFASEHISLPGTSSAFSLVPKPQPELGGDPNGKKGKGGKQARDQPTGPGSKSKLAMPISATEIWVGGVVFKLDKIAQHYKMPHPDQVCWPVLLTKKQGDAALEICPDHAAHGDLKQAVHKRPANFNLDHIYKHFTRGATAAENKAAGWEKPPKKSKI